MTPMPSGAYQNTNSSTPLTNSPNQSNNPNPIPPNQQPYGKWTEEQKQQQQQQNNNNNVSKDGLYGTMPSANSSSNLNSNNNSSGGNTSVDGQMYGSMPPNPGGYTATPSGSGAAAVKSTLKKNKGYEIDYSELIIDQEVGRGAYGVSIPTLLS